MAATSAVIFDMDGLMLDTERVSLTAWQRAAADLGHDLPDTLWRSIIGMNSVTSGAWLREQLGESFALAELTARTQEHYQHLLHTEGIALKAGLTDLLDWLASRRVPCAVATSTRHALAIDKLTRVGLVDRFVAIIGGDQVERGKPAPDIYLKAAEALGQPPRACIALEDSINGIRAAHAAGVPVMLVPDLVDPPADIQALALATLVGLSDARAIIEARLAAT